MNDTAHYRVELRHHLGKRTVIICHFARPPIVENVNGFRRVVGRGDWGVVHTATRVRTVQPEAPGMREYFADPLEAGSARRSRIVVVKTATDFQFWDVATKQIAFSLEYDTLAALLDDWVAAGRDCIELAKLLEELQRRSC